MEKVFAGNGGTIHDPLPIPSRISKIVAMSGLQAVNSNEMGLCQLSANTFGIEISQWVCYNTSYLFEIVYRRRESAWHTAITVYGN